MSIHALSAVLAHSEAHDGSRLTALALAEAASDDGVTWLDQETISERTRLTSRQIRNCIRTLEELGELEVRKAQAGRRRFNVYRLVLPGLREVNYERLAKYGVKIPEPFTTGNIFRSPEADDRKSTTATTGNLRPIRDTDTSLLERTVREPSEELAPAARSPDTVKPPPIPRIDGRDVVFDALSRECEADPEARGGEIAKAKARIATLTWGELTTDERVEFLRVRANEVDWARFLAREVERRAALYRRGMGEDVPCTPSALAKWWRDVPRLAAKARARGLTAEEIGGLDLFGDRQADAVEGEAEEVNDDEEVHR